MRIIQRLLNTFMRSSGTHHRRPAYGGRAHGRRPAYGNTRTRTRRRSGGGLTTLVRRFLR